MALDSSTSDTDMAPTPLSTAEDVMTRQVVTIAPATPVFEAIELLLEHSISAAPVVDDEGVVLGVLTENDCLKLIAAATYDDQGREEMLQAGRHMSEVPVLAPDVEIYQVVDMFRDAELWCAVVVDEGQLVGVISRRDLIRGLKAMESEFLAMLHRERRDTLTPSSFFGATRHDASEVASRLNR